MSKKNFGVFSLWKLPEKDLSNVIYSNNYHCPKCGAATPSEPYKVDGEEYPKLYNEVFYGNVDGTVHDWTEVHKCSNCKTLYKFINGCF